MMKKISNGEIGEMGEMEEIEEIVELEEIAVAKTHSARKKNKLPNANR